MTKEDKDKIFNDNMGLVYSVINKHFKNYSQIDKEDLLQEGFIALYNSIDRFDESKGFKFSTYATNNIWGVLTKYAETKILQKKHTSIKLENGKFKTGYVGADICSIYAKIADAEDGTSMVIDTLGEHDKNFDNVDIELAFEWVLDETRKLHDKYKSVKYKDADKVLLMKLEGYTKQQISKKLGLSHATVQARYDAIKQYFQKGA